MGKMQKKATIEWFLKPIAHKFLELNRIQRTVQPKFKKIVLKIGV